MGEAKRKEVLLAMANEELKACAKRPVKLDLDMARMMIVCSACQLALRHPGFMNSPSAKELREVLFTFRDQVSTDYPAIRQLIEMGFHQRFDR